MARVLLITNPAAARTSSAAFGVVVRRFQAAGWDLEEAKTAGPGDARRFAADAVAGGGIDVVAVLGGDGTAIQAASGLVGSGVALGLVPGGTGNLLAGNLRVPTTPLAATELILRGRTRAVDLGRLDRDDGVHYFGVACGDGAAADVMSETPTQAKRRWGIGGYFTTLFRVLPTIRAAPRTITVDGRILVHDAATVLVLNCGEVVPPWVRARFDTRLDDGVLDVVAVQASSPLECARGVARVLWNAAVGEVADTAYLVYARGREVTVAADPVQPVQYDGEGAGWTPFTATVVPRAIRVCAPEARGR